MQHIRVSQTSELVRKIYAAKNYRKPISLFLNIMEGKGNQDITEECNKENIDHENIEKADSDKKSEIPKYKFSDFSLDKNVNTFLLICVIGVSLGILLEVMNVQNREKTKDEVPKRRYWVYSAYSDVENKNGVLKHVHIVLDRVGYEKSTNKTDWSLLWSHDYPFRSLYPNMHKLKRHQKVNHFPGIGFITNKVDLATSKSEYIPRAFKLPQNKAEFLSYASVNKNALFLEKHNQHRGVYLKNVSEIDFSGESFVQEFVQKPFLVDGHKFDIGVYVVLTSVDPLRVYWYKGDVLFRYCPAKYYPFDPKNLDKYVIGDDYLPTWEVPSLAHPYTALGFSMKDSFDVYAKSKGKDTTKMWEDVQKAIADVFVKKEYHVIQALKSYPSSDNYFEMMRFDLVVDEDLKVYLLEANMSPNLSSAHYPPNQLLYEQVLYNLMGLVGVADHVKKDWNHGENTGAQNMVSTQKNIAVWGEQCSTVCKENCDSHELCELCRPCLNTKLRNSFLKAHREHLHKGDFRRLFPPPTKPSTKTQDVLKNLTKMNRLQYLWYQGKCNTDITWCT
ncbi:probable tubulin polyglutamylase ttll-15 [Manduca sexta]|uniref:probable tubulin polyglutamylase ttll-15 n=1 Tax=Manduca sexta TaxID=7130 RepID=UPI00188F62E0|nr:probable tubulin polyglutamylase ttll-15 [Manduca sexta]